MTTPPEGRSLSAILQDTFLNLQDLLRSEVQLARSEIKVELNKVKSSSVLLIAGAATTAFAVLFLLLTAVAAMALTMPIWCATLIVGSTLTLIAIVLLSIARKQIKQIYPKPARTVQSIKDNLEWAKQQVR